MNFFASFFMFSYVVCLEIDLIDWQFHATGCGGINTVIERPKRLVDACFA